MKTSAIQLTVLAIGWAAASSALASGSYSISGGDQANQTYHLGKSAFYHKLACSSCPLAGQDIDEAKAAELVAQLAKASELAQKLSETERGAVAVYLKRRYKLD
ncbi:MAG: hypothetical protein PHH59_16295 [Methylovulum sp.]|uniref:hypothetical protein n=1 Tax=Methylovulum sp. TaxID=1916980 RepID=UPI00261E8AFB|nr:hypothetical protein [Methylovulum sp.]MDD2725564.1 hypothetical protein [Methylovulum sp.]MDD5125366.1 hypothetical protein [Methylovulum sp.]